MEGSIMGGPILSAPEAGVLQLDPSLHHAATLHHHQPTLSHQLQGLAPLSSSQHLNATHKIEPSLGFDPKYTPKDVLPCGKGKYTCTSDEDEPSFTEDGDYRKKSSLWQRVKWTDSMVKLLIHIVIVMGEDGMIETMNDISDANKKKAGLLQKKGKWKSVSRLMNEKGCYVSPQQCEDKFNDLNKRYKRLNDILGKGIACCVVEDPNLLDTMENLSSKAKDDVRKILSSKQLFYKEICAYHSGCKSLGPAADLEFQQLVNTGSLGQGHEFAGTLRHQNNVESGDEDGDEDDDDENDEDDFENNDGVDPHTGSFTSPLYTQKKPSSNLDLLSDRVLNYTKTLLSEPTNVDQWLTSQDSMKPTPNQQQNLCSRMIQIEEQKVRLLTEAVALRKQQFKWERLNCEKYRELEWQRHQSKKLKLENERMSLRIKQKELEVECKRSEVSMSSMDAILGRLNQPKDSIDYSRAMG